MKRVGLSGDCALVQKSDANFRSRAGLLVRLLGPVAVPEISTKPGKNVCSGVAIIRRLPLGCPTDAPQQIDQLQPLPQGAARQSEEADEAARAAAHESQVSQQQVGDQGLTHQLLHRVGAVPREAAQLEGLLDLHEKHLDLPAAAIELVHGARGPRREPDAWE
jgi:hypothetical protein